MLFMYLFASILAGVTIVLARIINSNLAERIGTFQGTVINYIVGLFFSVVIFLISKEELELSYTNLTSVPLWAYLGGLTGVIVVVSSNYITPKISAFYATLLIFIGQLFIGVLIDYFMLQELSFGKLTGGGLVLIGLTYNLWIDKKSIPT